MQDTTDGRCEGTWRRWATVTLYAMGMAWVEAAVVFYLRTMIGRIDPHQPQPLPLADYGFAGVELAREFATLVMLVAVGRLAGGTWRARLGYAAGAFGVWDIFYYIFLKIICGWPHSLLDWDILFLLPLPWWGPVIAPVLISMLMISGGVIVTRVNPAAALKLSQLPAWVLSFAGIGMALYVFMADAIAAAPNGADAVRLVLPTRFNWLLFWPALFFMGAPLVQLAWRRRPPAMNKNREIQRRTVAGVKNRKALLKPVKEIF